MSTGSESEPLLNRQLPISSGAPQNGDAAPPYAATGKPMSAKLSSLGSSLRASSQHHLDSFRSSCATPTTETYLGIALTAGVVCGLVAFLYSSAFEALLDLVWTDVPEKLLLPRLRRLHAAHSWWPEPGKIGWVYTIAAATLMGTLAGTVQAVMGFPGDLPDTVECIHHKGFVPIQQAPSMFLCSSFSIAAGGSLGPEAPLLALCAASTSWLGRRVLQYEGARLRNCALIGMAAGLAAFFGVSLGGSLFALEVLHRTGVQFYEIFTFAVLAGLVCLLIFRGLAGIPYGPIWDWSEFISAVDYRHILLGGVGGVMGACLALVFMQLHKALKRASHAAGLHEHKTPILSGAVGGFLVSVIGVLLPPVMFWGEYEMNTLANFDNPLPHIWPKGGIWGLKPFLQGHYSIAILMMIAFAKLVAISITVLAGFRGGFIFPIFFAGTALGRGLAMVPHIPFVSTVPPVLLSMTLAAGVDVAITRTPFATPLILTTLSGHPEVMVPALCSSLVSLFLTMHFPFIMPQQDRRDVEIKEVSYDEEVDESDREDRAEEHPAEVGL